PEGDHRPGPGGLGRARPDDPPGARRPAGGFGAAGPQGRHPRRQPCPLHERPGGLPHRTAGVPGRVGTGVVTMATIEKALQIAARAHEGQVDKQGLPYILHLLRVMDGVEGLDAKIVAILHDVIEDTSVGIADLEAAGFATTVLDAVRCVTHADGESYAEYVVRCQADP